MMVIILYTMTHLIEKAWNDYIFYVINAFVNVKWIMVTVYLHEIIESEGAVQNTTDTEWWLILLSGTKTPFAAHLDL